MNRIGYQTSVGMGIGVPNVGLWCAKLLKTHQLTLAAHRLRVETWRPRRSTPPLIPPQSTAAYDPSFASGQLDLPCSPALNRVHTARQPPCLQRSSSHLAG
jgi:hypothetical protein